VPVDEVLLEQVFVNLLENAAKYTPPGTPVELSAEAGSQEVVVTVADRGPGTPAGEEERVFEKFQRAGSTAGSGVGLGLTICRGIVAAHGGRIWVERRPGRWRALPFHHSYHRHAADCRGGSLRNRAGARARHPVDRPAPLILLIEDEPQMRRFLRAARRTTAWWRPRPRVTAWPRPRAGIRT